MTQLLSLTLSDHSLWRLGSILVAITATIVLGTLIARILSNRDAASRHAVYLVALASVLILPVVITVLDHFGLNWSVRVLARTEPNPGVSAPDANSPAAAALNSDSLIIDLNPEHARRRSPRPLWRRIQWRPRHRHSRSRGETSSPRPSPLGALARCSCSLACSSD